MDMKKSFNYSTIAVIVLAVAVTVMAIGYAGFAQELKVNGSANISSASWNVQFDETSYQEKGNIAASSKTINGTSVTYSVTLTKPTDTFEFEIDVKNSGTFNAQLSSIMLTKLTEAQAKYLTYEVTYDGTSYSDNTENLAVALNSNTSKKLKVKVTYIQPEDPADLPTSTVPIDLGVTLNYDQVA